MANFQLISGPNRTLSTQDGTGSPVTYAVTAASPTTIPFPHDAIVREVFGHLLIEPASSPGSGPQYMTAAIATEADSSRPLVVTSGGSGAFPQVTLYDDFTGTGAINGTKWQAKVGSASAPDISCISDTVGGASSSSNGYTVTSWGPNLDWTIDCVTLLNDGSYAAFWWGMQTPGGSFTGYALVLTRASTTYTWNLRKYISGSNAGTITSPTSALTAGDSIGARQQGTNISFYRKTGGSWSTILSPLSDASITPASGRLAIEVGDTAQRWDNLSAGTLP